MEISLLVSRAQKHHYPPPTRVPVFNLNYWLKLTNFALYREHQSNIIIYLHLQQPLSSRDHNHTLSLTKRKQSVITSSILDSKKEIPLYQHGGVFCYSKPAKYIAHIAKIFISIHTFCTFVAMDTVHIMPHLQARLSGNHQPTSVSYWILHFQQRAKEVLTEPCSIYRKPFLYNVWNPIWIYLRGWRVLYGREERLHLAKPRQDKTRQDMSSEDKTKQIEPSQDKTSQI